MTPSIVCPACGAQSVVGSRFCAYCAHPFTQQQFETFAPPQAFIPQSAPLQTNTRKVGILLGIGIFLMPYLFAWLTLRRGYSNVTRGLSFAWLVVVMMMLALPPKPSETLTQSAAPAASVSANTLVASTPKSSKLIERRAQYEPVTPLPVAAPASKELLKLDYKWSSDGLTMQADFTIQNQSDQAVKDLKITCEHSAASGTKIDSNTRTIYEIVPAQGKKAVKRFNMGFIHAQAARSGCEIVDFEVVK